MLLGSDDGASIGDLSEDDIDKSRSSNRNHGSSDDGNATEDEIDGLLSRELMQTSLIDRNSILEEIHGVRCLAVQETPELIQKSLQEFQKELDKDQESSRSSSEAYRILLVRKRERQSRPSSNTTNFNTDHNKKQYHGDPDYNYAIDDEDFRLRFLRCELFDVPSAVKRFYNYLSLVHDYWGSVALDRPIRITDFTKSELKVFRMGFYQLLPFRDSSGRRMMVVLGGMKVHEDPSARDKILFYIMDVVTRDSIESQQKGFVIIRLYGDALKKETIVASRSSNKQTCVSMSMSMLSRIDIDMCRSIASIPSRIIAVHAPMPDHLGFQLIFKLILTQVYTANKRLLSRIIPGGSASGLEFRYKLKTYGIPVHLLPLTDTDSIKCTYLNHWMKTRKLLEEHELGLPEQEQEQDHVILHSSIVGSGPHEHHLEGGITKGVGVGAAAFAATVIDSIVECPALNDVVFRKGSRVTIENPGNRFFRDLIRTFLEERERTSEQLRQEEISTKTSDVSEAAKSANQSTGSNDNSSPLATNSPPAATKTAVLPPPPLPPLETLSPTTTTTTATSAASSSLSAKKHTGKAFCEWLVDYIVRECNGRFLEWNTDVSSWVIMREKNQITRKVSVTLYNWGKRLNTETAIARRHREQRSNNPRSLSSTSSNSTRNCDGIQANGTVYNRSTSKNAYVDDIHDDNDLFRFIDGHRPPSEQQGHGHYRRVPYNNGTGVFATADISGLKRSRNDSFPQTNRRPPT